MATVKEEGVVKIEGMLTTRQAWELAKTMGYRLSRAAISEAARRAGESDTGIEGAVKVGNTWLLPQTAFIKWIETRKPRGPEPGK